jgi:ubiquitin-protein ligase
VAVDFFEAQGWPLQDRQGGRQRAVVELVNPTDPDNTKRLNSEKDLCDSVVNGATVRIFPESIAGLVDYHARRMALIADHRDMQELSQQNPRIKFTANRSQAPDQYDVTFEYTSFVGLSPETDKPIPGESHCVTIKLGAGYPRYAPTITWQTPIFHPNVSPNIHQENNVCLGVLDTRYLPGMGLARLVRMLLEMLQWRNFDALNAFNKDAAAWAAKIENWPAIAAIGGYPLQGPIEEFMRELDRATQPPIVFKPL